MLITSRRRRIVLAPDKFKGTLPAGAVAACLAAGLRDHVDATAVSIPIADGGDGSVEAALTAGYRPLRLAAADAWGQRQPVEVALDATGTRAVVEVAGICGLGAARPSREQALAASSDGVGEVVLHLLDRGVTEIALGLGGSVTSDGGSGFLRALGAELTEADGTLIRAGAAGLASVSRVELAGLDPRLAKTRLVLACDVTNPLAGMDGAAHVFGLQKGLAPADLDQVDAGLRRLSAAAPRGAEHMLAAGAGAAGGLGWAGLLVGGEVVDGAGYFIDLLGVEDAVRGADLVITGEGRLDHQSLSGKAPVAVARIAARHGVPAVAVVGQCELSAAEIAAVPLRAAVALADLDPRCAQRRDITERLLTDVVADNVGSWLEPAQPMEVGS